MLRMSSSWWDWSRSKLLATGVTPVFSAKLRVVSIAILEALDGAGGALRFSLLRTRAMLLVAMVSLQRGKQLGETRSESIMHFPDDRGLLFNYVYGKTLRNGTKHVFGVLRSEDVVMCPVTAMDEYICPGSGETWGPVGGARPLPFPAVQRRTGKYWTAEVGTAQRRFAVLADEMPYI